ncbi:MAG: GatB/YqeY domain-containing protein [Anaerolineae bacterium]|nr:GatB/YqeY domain-containing protein [Anaerolineae bacterium]
MDDPRVRLQNDMKAAMRAKDRQRLMVIRMALNAIKQEEIDLQKELGAEDAVTIIMREAKKRRESITEAESVGREDLAAEEKAELAILEAYLPQQLSEAEITSLAEAVIAELNVSSPKQMGDVMRVLMPRLKGQADGKLVNEVVRKLLTGQ